MWLGGVTRVSKSLRGSAMVRARTVVQKSRVVTRALGPMGSARVRARLWSGLMG